MRRSFLAMAVAASLVTAPSGLFDPLWEFLSSLWGTKAGCEWDPNGRCLPAPQPTSDIGCELDPNGGCLPAPQPTSDIGCGLDPSGGCDPS